MKKRVCIVTTTPFIVTSFLQPLLAELARDYEVTLAVNTRDGYPLRLGGAASVTVQHLPIARSISPLHDLRTLVRLVILFARNRFDAVHSFAPKAGLLGMLAAFLTSVPHRFHTFQGEVWAARTGVMRRVLRGIDAVVARLATNVLVVGRGEQAFLEASRVLRRVSTVLGDGSIAGVDTQRFRPNMAAREALRRELALPRDAFVVLFLGRLVRDKGVLDLAEAFRELAAVVDGSYLVFVGPDEDALAPAIYDRAAPFEGRVHLLGYTATPENYLAAADILCVPSYREGFATVILEASACGVAVIASQIYGTQDALVSGETGLFYPPRNVRELGRLLVRVARDPEWRARAGAAGRARVIASFSQERVIGELRRFYMRVKAPQPRL